MEGGSDLLCVLRLRECEGQVGGRPPAGKTYENMCQRVEFDMLDIRYR